MPTGYTDEVANGNISDFSAFAMRCSRAFGALVDMRDDSLNEEIPLVIEPDVSYYEDQLKNLRLQFAELMRITGEEAEKRAHDDWVESVKLRDKCFANVAEIKKRYESMLEQVEKWEPPTNNHKGLKSFMINQLKDSIEYDCNCSDEYYPIPVKLTGADWLEDQVASVIRSIETYTENRNFAIKRAADSTLWLQQLRNSLKD